MALFWADSFEERAMLKAGYRVYKTIVQNVFVRENVLVTEGAQLRRRI